MQKDTDSTDMPTLRRETKLKISPTNVGRLLTMSVKCRSSVMRSVGKVSVRRAKRGECKVSAIRRKKFCWRFQGVVNNVNPVYALR
jgi:hypothetical protein